MPINWRAVQGFSG